MQNTTEKKDRVTIEETFEALLRFVESLDEEEQRAAREGLDDQEQLALFDILTDGKSLTPAARERVKTVAKELLSRLEERLAQVSNWRDKEPTRALVRQ